ncbi:MAG TPA: hypothetical protein EYN64_01125, partial [Flavobacteriales bacterium]|nr:hypothetical protein [Flavobacteriales bacterium]
MHSTAKIKLTKKFHTFKKRKLTPYRRHKNNRSKHKRNKNKKYFSRHHKTPYKHSVGGINVIEHVNKIINVVIEKISKGLNRTLTEEEKIQHTEKIINDLINMFADGSIGGLKWASLHFNDELGLEPLTEESKELLNTHTKPYTELVVSTLQQLFLQLQTVKSSSNSV